MRSKCVQYQVRLYKNEESRFDPWVLRPCKVVCFRNVRKPLYVADKTSTFLVTSFWAPFVNCAVGEVASTVNAYSSGAHHLRHCKVATMHGRLGDLLLEDERVRDKTGIVSGASRSVGRVHLSR